jgi:FlaA1/EpsC-like NDP-sugar epimerase
VSRFRRFSAFHKKNESLPSILDIIYIDININDIDANALDGPQSMAALLRIKFERRLLRQNTMKLLVTGATGTVGGEAVQALLQRGADASRT